jgi:hypothetical protein
LDSQTPSTRSLRLQPSQPSSPLPHPQHLHTGPGRGVVAPTVSAANVSSVSVVAAASPYSSPHAASRVDLSSQQSPPHTTPTVTPTSTSTSTHHQLVPAHAVSVSELHRELQQQQSTCERLQRELHAAQTTLQVFYLRPHLSCSLVRLPISVLTYFGLMCLNT